MAGHGLLVILSTSCLLWADAAGAFRSCDTANSKAFAAFTRYTVGELAFDATTGMAGGTETTYSYSNRAFEGFTECHVTYELSGNYEPVSKTFLLDARRSNHSSACPDALIDIQYPDQAVYAFQVIIPDSGNPVVLLADSGEFFASATWSDGRTAYKTNESCTIF